MLRVHDRPRFLPGLELVIPADQITKAADDKQLLIFGVEGNHRMELKRAVIFR